MFYFANFVTLILPNAPFLAAELLLIVSLAFRAQLLGD